MEARGRGVGSPEFFDALERCRYDEIDYLEDPVDLPRFRGKEVLEIGCGTGIDLTQNSVNLARANLVRAGSRASILSGTAEALGWHIVIRATR